MVTSTDGAHDRKHLVVSVTDMGVQPKTYGHGDEQVYAVVLRTLGHFYADDRFKYSARGTENQRELRCPVGSPPVGRVHNFILSVPVGSKTPPKTHDAPKTKKVFHKGKMITVAIDWVDPKAVSGGGTQPAKSPEAVLDSFKIR